MAGGLSPAAALDTGVRIRAARRGSPAVWLLLGPPSLVLTLLFMLPIGLVLVTSVTDPRLSLAHYQRIFTVPLYTHVMLNTFVTSLIVTALCLVLGYPVAYVMARRSDWVSTLLLTIVAMSFWTGFLVRTYAWLVILGSKGPVVAAYHALGLGGPAPKLLFTSFASTLGMTHILLPYMILALFAVMKKIEPDHLKAAASLGARPTGGVHGGVPAAQPAGGRERQPARLRQLPGFLRNAHLARHAARHDDLAAHQPADGEDPRVGVRRRGRGDPPARHRRDPRRLQPVRRTGSAMGVILALLVAAFLLLPIVIIIPMSFSTAISFEFPPRATRSGYYAKFFTSEEGFEPTLNSVVIALGATALTMLLVVPAAFGYVRYRFRGKALVNLLVMAPLIVPHVVSALAYYELIGRARLTGTHLGVIVAHGVLAVPVAFLVISATLKGSDRNLERAAISSGAGPLRTFF